MQDPSQNPALIRTEHLRGPPAVALPRRCGTRGTECATMVRRRPDTDIRQSRRYDTGRERERELPTLRCGRMFDRSVRGRSAGGHSARCRAHREHDQGHGRRVRLDEPRRRRSQGGSLPEPFVGELNDDRSFDEELAQPCCATTCSRAWTPTASPTRNSRCCSPRTCPSFAQVAETEPCIPLSRADRWDNTANQLCCSRSRNRNARPRTEIKSQRSRLCSRRLEGRNRVRAHWDRSTDLLSIR